MFLRTHKIAFFILFTLTQLTACKSLFGNFGKQDNDYCDEATPCPSPQVCVANKCMAEDATTDGGTGDGGETGNSDLAGADLTPPNPSTEINIFAPKMTGVSHSATRIYRGKFVNPTVDSMMLVDDTSGLSVYHATNKVFSQRTTVAGINFPDSNAVGKAISADTLDSFAQLKVSSPNSTIKLYRFIPGQTNPVVTSFFGTDVVNTKLTTSGRITFARISDDKNELVITDKPGHFVVYRINADGSLTPAATTVSPPTIDLGFTYQPRGIAAFFPNIVGDNDYIFTNFVKTSIAAPMTVSTQIITYKVQYDPGASSYLFTEVYRYDVQSFDKSTDDNILVGQFDNQLSADAAMIFGSNVLHLFLNPISAGASIQLITLASQVTANNLSLMMNPLKPQPDIIAAGGANALIEQFTYQSNSYSPVSLSGYKAGFGRYQPGTGPYHIAGFFDDSSRPSLAIYHQDQMLGKPTSVALAASHDQATPWVTRLAEQIDLPTKWTEYREATPEGQLYYGPLSSNTSREILILPAVADVNPVKAYTSSFASIGTNNTVPMPATASSGKFYTCGANRAFGFVSQEAGIRNFNAAHISNGKLTFHPEGISTNAGEQVLDISIRHQPVTSQHQLVLLIGANTARIIRTYKLSANTLNPTEACASQSVTSINLGGGVNLTNIINADMDGDGIDDYLVLGPGNVSFRKSDSNGFLIGGGTISPIILPSPITATGHGNFVSKSREQAVVLSVDMSARVSSLQVIHWMDTSFDSPRTINLPSLYTQLVVEDLNGDGYSDLLLLGTDVGAVAVLPGGPSGLGQPILYQTGNGPLSLTVASPNAKGGLRPDILTYHGGPTPHLFRLRNLSP